VSDDERLVPIEGDAVRARRRPLAIVLVWACQAIVASALAWPIVAWVSGVYGDHPDGDGAIWRPGGLALFELLVRTQALPALTAHALLVVVVSTALGLFPMALLIASVLYATPEGKAPRLRAIGPRACRALAPFVALFVMVTLAQLLVLGLGLVASLGLARSCAAALGDARAQQIGVIAFAPFLLLAVVGGIVHDFARAARLRYDSDSIEALRIGLTTWRRGPVTALWSWAWRAFASCAPVAVGVFVAQHLGGRAGAALLALAAIHQLIALARVAVRASWLAKAARLVDVRRAAQRRESALKTD
jgi:hypothetical protein